MAKAKRKGPAKAGGSKPENAGIENTIGSSKKAESLYWLFAALILCVCIFFAFYKLGVAPARDWDEARHGVSAYEMIKTGNYVVNTYQYQPDYYNLKPVLSFWGVVLGYRMFGYSLFGMRFCSGLAFVLTVTMMGAFCRFRYGRLYSLMVMLTLTACAPFYRYHFARHADADALFGFFCVAALVAMFLIQDFPWAFPACSFAFALAFLTKSWHALFIPPVVFLYLLFHRLFFRLKPWQWAAFVAAGALPILLWAAARYQYDGTKFFAEMIRVDLLNRSSQVLEEHSGGFDFYLQLLQWQTAVTGNFPLIMVALHLLAKLCVKLGVIKGYPYPERLGADLPFWGVAVVVPWLLFSVVKTKIAWYIIPVMFPAAALGALLWGSFWESQKETLSRLLLGLLAAVVIFPSILQVWEQINYYTEDPLQQLLQDSTQAMEHTAGEKVYLGVDARRTPYGGTQKYVLMGELLYDWEVTLGSAEKFLADPEASILLVETESPEGAVLSAAGCSVAAEGAGYSIYEKKT